MVEERKEDILPAFQKKPTKFKSPNIKLATHSNGEKRNIIDRAATAIHEAKHIIINQMVIAYRLGLIEESDALYEDAKLADTLYSDLGYFKSEKFYSGYKNQVLETEAINAGNEAKRFFNYEALSPTIRIPLDITSKAIRWSFVDLPRMAPYMPLPRI